MKITNEQLRRIIKEELEAVLSETLGDKSEFDANVSHNPKAVYNKHGADTSMADHEVQRAKAKEASLESAWDEEMKAKEEEIKKIADVNAQQRAAQKFQDALPDIYEAAQEITQTFARIAGLEAKDITEEQVIQVLKTPGIIEDFTQNLTIMPVRWEKYKEAEYETAPQYKKSRAKIKKLLNPNAFQKFASKFGFEQ
jgi:hypothetical protein